MPTKANEYWGRIGDLMQPRGPEDEGAAGRPCSTLGHAWPDEDGLPCERCGKPSALPGPDYSNPPYVAERDALIPIAEAAATVHVEVVAARRGSMTLDEWGTEWTRKFHETMDVLGCVLHHASAIDALVHPRAKP